MSTAASATPETPARSGKYLTFFLGQEEYGIEILRVREIIGLMPITEVPRTPGYVRGVMNLRGKVIQIVSLRSRLELPEVEETDDTCVIVALGSDDEPVGLIVDKVSEVTDIAADEIADPPTLGDAATTDFLLGLARSEGRVRLLLEIDRVLGTASAA